MQLEVNKDHKKIEFGRLKKPIERFTIGLLGTTMAISLFSGSLIPKAYAMREATGVTISEDDREADIPAQYKPYIRNILYLDDDEPILESMINKITFLAVNAGDKAELEYLKCFPNLTELSVRDFSGNGLGLSTIKDLPNLKGLFVYAYTQNAYLNSDSLSFLDSLNLDNITLHGFLLCPGCEEKLNNVSEVQLSNGFYDIDFSKLTDIDKLDFSCDDVYDYSIYFSKKDYDALVANGVEVDFGNNAEKFFSIDSRLNSIIDSLGINKNSSDQAKLDAVLLYVLENLQYDEYVSSQTADGNNNDGSLTKGFYVGGFLYAALERDSAICGNYAALVEALINRVGTFDQSAFVHNETHAWNVVKVDGEPYLVDATWLDDETIRVGHPEEQIDSNGEKIIVSVYDEYSAAEVLKAGYGHELKWYMERMDDAYIGSIDPEGSHKGALVPEYMFSESGDITSNSLDGKVDSPSELAEEIDGAPDITNNKFKIKIGSREMIIAGGALIGVLSALGGAVCIKKRNERKRKRYVSRHTLFDDEDDLDYMRRR